MNKGEGGMEFTVSTLCSVRLNHVKQYFGSEILVKPKKENDSITLPLF
jgi:hypothetical protein